MKLLLSVSMRFVLFAYLLVVQGLYAMTTDALWEQWKSMFGKQYGPGDELGRRQKWEQTVKEIKEHNLKHDLGLVTYTMGLNQFSAMDWDEFKSLYLMKNMADKRTKTTGHRGRQNFDPILGAQTLPTEVDWRKHGMVTEVEQQGICNSCWSFSVTGVVEGQFKKKTGKLMGFSKQEMLDCGSDYDLDCDGGWPDYAMQYVVDFGLSNEDDYPYEGFVLKCFKDSFVHFAKGYNYTLITDGDESKLTQAIASVGPISICIEMDDDFRKYKGGIYKSDTCGKQPTHAMLAVGYGSENGQDYYIIKNSWDIGWGEQGYVRFARNANNTCGVASYISYLTLA